ncbi:MAG: hypothetical protein ABJ004_04360 [Cyclobacteriaceae bacterium]
MLKTLKYILIFLGATPLAYAQVTVQSGLPVTVSSGLDVFIPSDLTVAGELSNDGTIRAEGDIVFSDYSGSGAVVASGTNQSLDLQSASIANLSVEGGDKEIQSGVNIENLIFSNARVFSNDQNLTVTGSIVGADASSHVVGKLIRSGSATLFYPVASTLNEQYAPVILDNITGTTPAIAVELFETNPLGTAGYGLLDVSNERYWQVSESSGNFESANIEVSFVNELLSGEIDDLVIASAPSPGETFSSLGVSSSSGNVISGTIRSATPSGVGTYSLGLFFDEQLRENDLDALLAIYDNLGGDDWTVNTGWEGNDLDNFDGISVTDKRVSGIDLSGNNLVGDFPEITEGLEEVTSLDVSDNEIRVMPDLSSLASLASLDVSDNRLEFGSLEANTNVDSYVYSPQKTVGSYTEALLEISEDPATISRQITGSSNTYSWFRRDKENNVSPVSGTTSSELPLVIENFEDEAYYYAEVTSGILSGVTLTTEDLLVKVSSLERDKLTLEEFYNSTVGAGWTDDANWLQDDDLDSWLGVDTLNNRVIRVELPDNNLTAKVPDSFADLSGLQEVDLSGNLIEGFPDISGLAELTKLDVSNNKLFFKDLVPNKNISGAVLGSQKSFGVKRDTKLDAGSNEVLGDFVDFDFGEGSAYQWAFGPLIPGSPFNNDVSPISGATDKFYLINDININSQGTYRLQVTHPELPGITIQSRNQNILAHTDFFGNVSIGDTPVSDAEVIVWRQTPSGPFVKEDSAFVSSNGDYLFEDVVLGNFVVVAKPNRDLTQYERTVQTYYEKAVTYTDADTLFLHNETDGVNIDVIEYTPSAIGTGVIGGLIETDFDETIVDEEDGRINGRRRVKKAGCAMRRFKAQGRPDQDDVEEEIAYYVETDDEGYFNFEGVADGKYLLTIEFPGVPLAEDAEVVFELGGDRENQVFDVNVLIDEEGINVTQEEILYNLKPYIKEVVLYPIPTDGLLSLDYLVYRPIDNLKLQVVTTQGVVLMEQEAEHWQGKQKASIDITNQSPGVYYLVFTDDDATFSHHIKVIRN